METHYFFFILAGVLIAILIGNSIWSARREKSRVFEANNFDKRPVHSNAAVQSPENSFIHQTQQVPQTPDAETVHREVEQSLNNIQIRLPNQPETLQAAPQQETPFYGQANTQEYAQQPLAPQYEQHEQSAPVVQLEPEPVQEVVEPTGIITLYVVAPQNQQFNGENVVRQLENLGFQFGEHQIFHRHIDNSASPVIFSVANMVQPGIFDLNQLHHFSTVGLVFFMHLPSPGQDLVNLRLMMHTVDSFAQELGGFVLNDQQQLFDEASREEYLRRL